jgi:phosphatidylserine decarboxylase
MVRAYWTGKIGRAWSTPTKWYPIPIALGALVLVAVQYRKQRRAEPEVVSQREGGAVIKPDGPWQVSSESFLYLHATARQNQQPRQASMAAMA